MTDDLVEQLRQELHEWEIELAIEQRKQAADRIETLETALKKICNEPPSNLWDEDLYWWAVKIATKALEETE